MLVALPFLSSARHQKDTTQKIRFEAELFTESKGAKAEENSSLSGGGNVGYIKNDTWIKLSNVIFSPYDSHFEIYHAGTTGGTIECRINAIDGPLIATATADGTSGWSDYQFCVAEITQVIEGAHELYLLFKGGDGYLFNLDCLDKITNDPSAVLHKLKTKTSPENAGTIASSLPGTSFPKGTEISLTAHESFGYQFLQWADGRGETISTVNPISFVISQDTTVTAAFEAVNTYTLTVNNEGALGLGEYSITPTGKNGACIEYEEGTTVTVTAVENDVIKFKNWDNGSTELSRTVTMNKDVRITAVFDNVSFIAGWTFKEDRYAHPRIAELYSNTENIPQLFGYRLKDNALAENVRTNHRAGQNGFSVWNSDRGAFYYYQTYFSTKGYENINVSSSLLGYYYGADEWACQYSLDGIVFTNLSPPVTINTGSFTPIGGMLPTEAENQERVYIRWYPNIAGSTHGSEEDVTATLISNVIVKADEQQKADKVAPILQSSIPQNNATSVSASGSIILTYDEKMLAGIGEATLNGKVLKPEFINKTVKYNYHGLDYNTEYSFSVSAGAITDFSGNAAKAIAMHFRTIQKPIPTRREFNLIVDADATEEQITSGKYVRTIAEAFDAAPPNAASRFLVLITNGTYNLGGDGTTPHEAVLKLPSTKNNVSLIAQSKDGVILQGNPAQGIKNPVLSIESNDLYMENITIEHTDGVNNSGQKPALNPAGDRNIYKGVTIRSKQDTQVTGGGRSFYYKSTIEGDVDFICGGGIHWFEACSLKVVSNGYIVAPAHRIGDNYGYVFNDNTIVADVDYYLGRPWQGAPQAVFLNTTMLKEPNPKGWTSMGVLPKIFAEYNSVNASGGSINTDNRTNKFKVNGEEQTGLYNPVLTKEEARVYTIENVLAGDDNWNPMSVVEQIESPVNLKIDDNSRLTWDRNNYAICYVISRDGELIDITTDASIGVSNEQQTHTYTVQAASEYGGLSEPSSITLEKEEDIDFVFTGAENRSWDNPNNFLPIGIPLEGDTVSCRIEMETTNTDFAGSIVFSENGTLRLRGDHTAIGTLIFKDKTKMYYYTGGSSMSLNAPLKIEGTLTCEMMSKTEGQTSLSLTGDISGNGTIVPFNIGQGEIWNVGVLELKGDNSAFTGTWDLTQQSSKYSEINYNSSIDANSENALGAGKLNIAQDNYITLNHARAAGDSLGVNVANNGKIVLNTTVNVQSLIINGEDYTEGVYDNKSNPTVFDGIGRIEVNSEYAGGGDVEEIPAFPGAEGHGRYVTGGRGGRIIYVTNLNDSGEGSLRHAINQSGPRIVLFKVSGTIELESELGISDDITIAGQSAPGGGICLRNYPVKVRGNNIIIRYLRFRMGDTMKVEDDALGGRFQRNIIIDHCSMSWSTDECVSFYENSNFTLQWCIITESLTNSVHGKGAHGYGGIWGGLKASFHHNLLSHHSSRTPRFGEYAARVVPLEGLVDMRNNVIYNWNGEGCYGGDAMNVNVVNNYYKPGPATADKRKERIVSTGRSMDESSPLYDVWGRFYIQGNVVVGSERATKDNWEYGVFNQFHSSQGTITPEDKEELQIDSQHEPGAITTHNAERAYELVLDYAGASLYRDEVDERAVHDTRNGVATIKNGGNGSTNGFIDTQAAVGSWPELPAGEAPKDTDSDGMPDDWETAHDLNPNNSTDGNQIELDTIYTNVEVYINSLVSNITNAQNGNLDIYVTPENFNDKYPTADNGARFIMSGGVYEVGELPLTNNSYTFVAQNDEQPIFAGCFSANDAAIANGGLVFDGVDINPVGDNSIFIKLTNGAGITCVEVKNAIIQGIEQNLISTEGESDMVLEKIVLKNCIVNGSEAGKGSSFIAPQSRLVKVVEITKSTIYNYSGINFVLLQGRIDKNGSLMVSVEDNTIYNACNKNGTFVHIDNNYDNQSVYSFRNNIVLDERNVEKKTYLLNITANGGAGNVLINGNLMEGVIPSLLNSSVVSIESNSITLGDLGIDAIAFPNPTNGDFSFTKNSPLATASTSGGVLGDPQWLRNDALVSKLVYINSINGEEIAHVSPVEYIEGAIQVLPRPILEGYTFYGWSDTNEYPARISAIPETATGRQTFYAFWGEDGNNKPGVENTEAYTISYHNLLANSMNPNPLHVLIGVPHTLQEASCPGYRFMGWFFDANYQVEASYLNRFQTNNVELFARWKNLGYFYAFPTFSTSTITLNSSVVDDVVSIINVQGIVLKRIYVEGNQTTISVESLPAGTYVVSSEKTGKITKFIVN